MDILEMNLICELIEQIIDFCISKYGAFFLAISTFFFPIVLYLKCKYEECRIRCIRKNAILQFTKDEYEEVPDETAKKVVQLSVIDYGLVNQYLKENLGIEENFIQNDKPLFNDDSIIISWHRLFRSYEVYNNSLCSGFWSFFFGHKKLELYTKVGFIQYFENKEKTKSMLLLELIHEKYSIIYKIDLK
jgi:hypothetical protein